AFDITLPEIKLDKGDIGLEKNIGRSITREDILKLVSVASTREKALIYLMAMSGMGQQEARDLTIKKFLNSAGTAIKKELSDIEDLFKNENEVLNEVLTLEIRRKKVNYKHHTFIPPEVSREILTYLKERCYGRNEKIRIKDQNEPIFVNNYGGKLSRDSIVTNFRRIGKQAGFQKEKGSYSYWRSHALRKYFISTISNKIGEKTIANYMAGHKISDQDRTYWRTNPEDLKKYYLKALPYLSLDKAKVKDVETKEFKIIMEDSKRKDKKIEDLEKTVELLKEEFRMKEKLSADDEFPKDMTKLKNKNKI
ncbi:MAG: site-specific integrase, partial [Methanobacterium paludis]|nr:site-specific integrase [Methanobacterium paludis]